MAHILVIDDDEQFRTMLAQMLGNDGHQVSQARDGAEGLRMAAQSKPELIITDILMPNMDGIDAIMALSRQGSRVPIIAISGGRRSISAEFNLDSAALIGVTTTLAKPFSRAELQRAIHKALAA